MLLCTITRHGLPSKLTGAGGGGCGYSYIPPGVPVDGAVRDLQALGYDCFQSVVGGPGVLFYPKQ